MNIQSVILVMILTLLGSVGGRASADPLLTCVPRISQEMPRAQIQFGKMYCRNGMLTVVAGAKQNGQVGKSDVIVPFGRVAKRGQVITVKTNVFIPVGRPRNSIHLMDLECKACGLSGNPGLRLYLRDGRLRIDRAKIGVSHAWVNDKAPRLNAGRWVSLEWVLGLSDRDDGWTHVKMNGVTVLSAQGRTVPLGPVARGVDRLQIGITANSNPVSAVAHFRGTKIDVQSAPRS